MSSIDVILIAISYQLSGGNLLGNNTHIANRHFMLDITIANRGYLNITQQFTPHLLYKWLGKMISIGYF
jgi:hypothetical protein